MPFVRTAFLNRLIKAAGKKTALFVFQGEGLGFPCILPKDALKTVLFQIESGQFSMQALAEKLSARAVRPKRKEVSELININTPEDWAKARQLWQELSLIHI